MSLLSQFLSDQVPSGSRSRGRSYFSLGAVRSLTNENYLTQATVRGSKLYTVWVEADRSLLRASCTCRFFIDQVEICKHIWAVILAAEAQSVPLVPPDVRLENVDIEPFDPDELLDDEDDQLFLPDVSAQSRFPYSGGPRASAIRTPARRVPPPWEKLLDEVGLVGVSPAAIAPQIGAGQLMYVIDTAASAGGQALVLELLTRDRKANGEWGKPKSARLGALNIATYPNDEDREILERLRGPQLHLGWSSWSYAHDISRLQLSRVIAGDLMPRLCATERCFVRRAAAPGRPPTDPPFAQISWDAGPVWEFTVAIRPAADATGYTIEGWLRRGEDNARLELSQTLLMTSDLLFTERVAARHDAGRAFGWLVALRQRGRIDLPLDARDRLVDVLLTSSPHLSEIPDELRIEIVDGDPQPRLRLMPLRMRADRVRTELTFDYGGHVVASETPQPIVREPGASRVIRRQLDKERQSLVLLQQLGCRMDWNQGTGDRALQIPAALVPQLVGRLLTEAWHVEAEGRIYRRPGSTQVNVQSGIDWFELRGSVSYDDQRAELPALLSALRRGERFVTLGDGSIGMLPEEWLQKYAPMARLGSASGDHVRFTRTQVALLDALIAAQPEASYDETFAHARSELSGFDGIRAMDPPVSFTGVLRGYQKEGLGWLVFLQRFGFGGCLADDMGLGKTVMVLALLAARRDEVDPNTRQPSLVVAPRSLVFNWRQEASRFAPSLRVLEYVGSSRAAMRASFADHDLVLTTYGTLRRDGPELAEVPFDYVVLDEAQAIKNASSVSAKATRVLRARFRLALSGTPIENHLGELWSLFEFLNPGLLGSAVGFDRLDTAAHSDEAAVGLLSRGLRPFILRRTKEQVASDLPPKSEQTIYCELERPQRALYDELRTHYRHALLDRPTNANGSGRAKLQILEALLRLRQAACHPGLIDPARSKDASAKLDVLVPRLMEAVEEGHKTLVFSQFTSLLAILRARLDERGVTYEYLDGRTRDRQQRVERFQSDPACRLFLISLKAGGLGLNLTAAEYVFLLDPWWNPAVEAQAIDRAHRIGQARHVFAYRLIARDTVEERVLELQQRKRKLADAILSADGGLLADLKREDLELLFS
jgi:superfamily II DNA or RNA helicase